MKMNAWMKVGAIGFAASLFAAGCVVTSTSDTDGGIGGFGGSATGGSGGTATGGSGGTTGGTGGTATGGSGGTGGAAPLTCNPTDPANGKCDTCMQTTCCTEWEACMNDNTCRTEFGCIKQCVDAQLASDAGTADPNACASQCAQGSTISLKTNDLVSCARDTEGGASCGVDCFGGF